jgi:hypothetical protein
MTHLQLCDFGPTLSGSAALPVQIELEPDLMAERPNAVAGGTCERVPPMTAI